jgi:Skp family chaperone for outer membrane proteins
MSKINRKSLAVTAGGIAALLAVASFRHSDAQGVAAPLLTPAKIGIVNLGQVLNDDKGFKAVKADLQVKGENLTVVMRGHQATLDTLQGKRKQDKPGTPQYETDTQDLEKQNLQFKSDDTFAQFQLQRDQSQALKKAYDAVSAAAASVAKREGIDIVMVDNGDEIPAGAVDSTPDAMQQFIAQHSILYSSTRVDITAKVAAEMDALRMVPPPAPAAPAH